MGKEAWNSGLSEFYTSFYMELGNEERLAVKSVNAAILSKAKVNTNREDRVSLLSVSWKYTLLFIICAFFCFLPYLIYKRSFIYQVDGRSQYIVYLRYMGQYLRENLMRFFQGNLEPIMYDFSIGLGDDINAIVRFHPLDFLSVFCPGHLTEYLYDGILLIRYYLSGLCFCAFALTWRKKGQAEPQRLPDSVSVAGILAGAMVYVFCGYMLMRVMNHPTYAAPFIILPLMLIAAEKVMEGHIAGTVFFPIVTFLGFVSNYYFMYISSIALLVYMLVRFPEYSRKHTGISRSKGSVFLNLFFRMAGLYITGVCMSLAIFLPTMIRYANSSRTTQIADRQNLLFYPDIRRYFAWTVNLFTPYVRSGNGTNLNYSVIVLPALISLFFFRKKKYQTLKRILLIELACLLIPVGGYIMAGFQNENNRWMYLISLALGMAVTFTADTFYNMNAGQARLLAAAAFAFTAASAVAAVFSKKGSYTVAAVLEVAACTIVLIMVGYRKRSLRTVRITVLVIACLSVVLNAWMTFLPEFGNMVSNSTKAGKAFRRFEKGVGSIAEKLAEEGFYRIDVSALKAGTENSGIYAGYYGTSVYNSILNSSVLERMKQTGNIGLDSLTHLQDLDGRFPAESFAGVKYYLTKRKGDRPFGFSEKPVSKIKRYYVYENELQLPFAYSSDSVILRSDYEKMDPVSRELIMLHGSMVDSKDIPEDGAWNRITVLPEELITKKAELSEPSAGMVQTEDGYRVDGRKGILTLTYDKKPGYQCLLVLKGLEADEESRSVKITSGSLRKVFVLRSPKDTYTLGRKDYVVDLMAASGAMDAGSTAEVTITFRKSGHYHLESASIVYIPVDRFKEEIESMSQDAMTDPVISSNEIIGLIHMSRNKIVTFQVPFQQGWDLYVDGENTPIFCSNGCYLGAVIQEGEHEILLKYTTPGLRLGSMISLVSFLAWILLTVYCVVKRRQRSSISIPGKQ